MFKPHNKKNISNARQLRREMTPEERHLWYDFLRYCAPRFRRQEVIGNYIADFYCNSAKLVVELDGSQHTEDDAVRYDSERTAYFATLGITVSRYYNNDITSNFNGVCQHILLQLEERGLCPQLLFPE